ncbi:MAG: hypothetical protein LBS62_03940 [Clostridiales bacterium]|jgi:hypothetical protein|nr:hypothetical protein [Clostridiales bacterium]
MSSVTVEDVLILIKDSLEESGKEFNRRLEESGKEFSHRLEESDSRFMRRLEESSRQAELDRRQTELVRRQTEFDRRQTELEMKELRKQAELEMKELRRQLGGLGNRFGDWAESYFNKRTIDKFCELGYKFTKSGRLEFKDANGDCFAEADIWMENGEYVMVVEVKSDLRKDHIDEHLERIHKIREYMDARGDSRKILGAVAAMTFYGGCEKYAVKNGLYAVTQSGENVMLLETPNGWKPTEF